MSLAFDATAVAEVGAQVGAVGVEHVERPGGAPEGHEVGVEVAQRADVARHRSRPTRPPGTSPTDDGCRASLPSSTSRLPEVPFDDIAGLELERLAGEDDLALVHEVGEVGEGQGPLDVLLDEEDGRGPVSRRVPSTAKISSTTLGASPKEISSARTTAGCETTARATASICCWPPDSVPATCPRRSSRIGNSSNTSSLRSPRRPSARGSRPR